MERLTSREPRASGMPGVCCTHFGGEDCQTVHGYCSAGCPWEEAAWERLAAYEDALPLERAEELAQAEKNGRLVVLPCGEGDELIKNGSIFKADHWNVLLTAFADDASAPSGKRVKLFYPKEAEAALKKREADDEAVR